MDAAAVSCRIYGDCYLFGSSDIGNPSQSASILPVLAGSHLAQFERGLAWGRVYGREDDLQEVR